MPGSARLLLRDATADWHEQVDRRFADVDLADRNHYCRFLAAHAAALLPIELALDAANVAAVVPDWPLRRRGQLIREDLTALGRPLPSLEPVPVLGGPAAIIGAVYVLEGSRLGGTVLSRQVGPGLPKRYLTGNRQASWQHLVALIDRLLATPEDVAAATAAACDVFATFDRGGQRHLS